MPTRTLDRDAWINPQRLPLGEPYYGTCVARPSDQYSARKRSSASFATADTRAANATAFRKTPRGRRVLILYQERERRRGAVNRTEKQLPILQRILTLAAADTELRQKRRVVHPRPVRLKIE